jgi:hypothetical protein
MAAHPPLPPPPPGAEPEPSPLEPEESPRSIGKLVVAFLGLVAVVAGVVAGGIWWLGAPSVCETSTVESARFGYCIAAPGWEYTNEQREAQLPYDELIRPTDASTVRIVAIQLDAGQDLDAVVQTVRSIETEDGIEVGEVVERRVAGVPAAQWDISLGDGSVAQQIREVVFVRSGTAWRVQLLADAEGFDVRLEEFEAILRSWIFR